LWAADFRCLPCVGPETNGKTAILATAGIRAGHLLICIWQVRGLAAEKCAELEVVKPDSAATDLRSSSKSSQLMSRETPSHKVISLAVAPSASCVCALQACGGIIVASASSGMSSWSVCKRINVARTVGLKLCAAGGLQERFLDTEESFKDDASFIAACALHIWSDNSVGLIFPGMADMGPLSCCSEVVVLTLPELHLAATEPYRVMGAPSGVGKNQRWSFRISGFGFSGPCIVVVTQDGDQEGCTLSLLLRTQPVDKHDSIYSLPEASVGTSSRKCTRDFSLQSLASDNCALSGRARDSLQEFRALLGITDVLEFTERVLRFDPFPRWAHSNKDAMAASSLQLEHLLLRAKTQLEHALDPSGTSQPKDALLEKNDEDGWDLDFDDLGDETITSKAADKNCSSGSVDGLTEEQLQQLMQLLSRVTTQVNRLDAFRKLRDTACTINNSLSWHDLRDADQHSLESIARLMASDQCVTAIQHIFTKEPEFAASHWQRILDALPETAPACAICSILPALSGSTTATALKSTYAIEWYIHRAETIIGRTGLCTPALELLKYGIHMVINKAWPREERAQSHKTRVSPVLPTELPALPAKLLRTLPQVRKLYGAFRLCAEYNKYTEATLQDLYCRRREAFENSPNSECMVSLGTELLSLAQFCALSHGSRAQLALRRSKAGSVVEIVRDWAHCVSLEECFSNTSTKATSAKVSSPDAVPLVDAAEGACNAPVEEAITGALIGCLNASGWDPATFQMVAEVVQASSQMHPQEDRLIKTPVVLLDFILGAVYSTDQRCRAMDIFESVDAMYSVIPKPDVEFSSGSDAERWQNLQKQADEMEKHLGCVEVLHKNKIILSLSFTDLRNGCINEPMAIRSLWNLFRVLGARYRPAVFWRGFKEELNYLHCNAFSAVSVNSVFSMYARCLVEQEHFEVLSAMVEDWSKSCCASDVVRSLVVLAQELVNSSPALKHASLEKARRVLRCVPQVSGEGGALVQTENDFIKACELLYDLVKVHVNPTQKWVDDLRHINPIASLSQVTTAMSAQMAALPSASGLTRSAEPEVTTVESTARQNHADAAAGFRIDSPLQLRLQLEQPLRIITDLLQFNPSLLLDSEELHTFCRLLGLGPASACWGEVMAMCGAANLLCGDRAEAFGVTEKLLTNGHPTAWKLALALSSTESERNSDPRAKDADNASALLADAALVCPPEELAQLLEGFMQSQNSPDAALQVEAASGVGNHVGGEGGSNLRMLQARGYVYDAKQQSSLSLTAGSELGVGSTWNGQDAF